MDHKLPDPKRPGDAIKAADYNLIVEAIRRIRINRGQSTGLDITESPGGTTLRVRWRSDRYVGLVQAGGISARSGSTPGSGTVNLQEYDETNNVTDTGIPVDVLNFSAGTSGFAAGKYVWIEQDVNGYWWVTAAECG